ncbi:MAG: hypothetical protein R3256_00325 [Thalassovita sp.]|nr:hypothetical protein [Thalassovita sp.]
MSGHAQNGKLPAGSDENTLVVAAKSGNKKTFDAFLAALRHMESRGDYKAVNTLNFIGAYQFGEAALVDLGYVRRDRDLYDNNFGGGFRGKDGIRSVADFLNNPKVQDKAARAWMKLMWHYIEKERLSRYAGKRVGKVTLSPSGMLGATHLLGTGGLKQFIQTGGSNKIRDPYGMPIASYIERLAGYNIPFAPGGSRVSAALN